MPDEIEAAVNEAVADDAVKVIVLRGAGRAFCAGFDFGGGFHHWDERLTTDGKWDPGKDFAWATSSFGAGAEVHERVALAQAGDRPGARLVRGRRQRLRAVRRPGDRLRGRAHRHPLLAPVGRLPLRHVALPARADEGEGVRAHRQAAERQGGGATIDLINEAVPFAELEDDGARSGREQLAQIPASQLAAMKLVVNQAYENMGLASTQTLGPILDGLMRNTPDALAAIEKAEREGVGALIADRDGPWGDYASAPADEQPDPGNVIEP